MFKKTSKKFFVRLIFLTILVLSFITVLKKYFPNQFTYHFQMSIKRSIQILTGLFENYRTIDHNFFENQVKMSFYDFLTAK